MVKKAAQAIPNQLLRRARLERGWTQQVVAERIGAPHDLMVSRWERVCWLLAVSVGQMKPSRTPHDISHTLPIPQSTCKIESIHLLIFTKG
jgi:hypothetical protein